MKTLHIVGIGIILVAVVYGLFGVKDSFRSYTTSVEEAKSTTRSVQLAGFLGSQGEYDDQGRWTFLLEERWASRSKLFQPNHDQPTLSRPSVSSLLVSTMPVRTHLWPIACWSSAPRSIRNRRLTGELCNDCSRSRHEQHVLVL